MRTKMIQKLRTRLAQKRKIQRKITGETRITRRKLTCHLGRRWALPNWPMRNPFFKGRQRCLPLQVIRVETTTMMGNQSTRQQLGGKRGRSITSTTSKHTRPDSLNVSQSKEAAVGPLGAQHFVSAGDDPISAMEQRPKRDSHTRVPSESRPCRR
jgi:hypothetical protein